MKGKTIVQTVFSPEHFAETDLAPTEESTFRHMFEIIDTNNLTHELSEHDWEVIEDTCPDLPILGTYFGELLRGQKK